MSTPEILINDARGYASNLLDTANSIMGTAGNRLSNIGYIIPTVPAINLENRPTVPTMPAVPDMLDQALELPPDPGEAPAYQDVGDLNICTEPRLQAQVPNFVDPARPGQLAEFTTQLPTINTSAQFPEPPPALDVAPAEPQLSDYAVPVKPQIDMPTFDKAVPTFDKAAPQDLPGQFQALYRDMSPGMVAVLDDQVDRLIRTYNPEFHPAMARIEAQLNRYLDGGTGFNPAVEDALYERARDKGHAELQRMQLSAWSAASARGFTLPGSTVAAALQDARQAHADNLARQATEIVVKQAELEQANLQFAVERSSSLRMDVFRAALSYHSNLIQINGQAINVAQQIIALVVEGFNAEVKAFQARLEAWRAEVQLFETRLKAALAAIDIYKAEIDALQALVQVDTAKVNIYRAKIDVLQALTQVYRTRIDAVLGQAEYEKLKLEVYRTQVQAYSARVDAKNSEWAGYRAALEGNNAKANLYSARVQAYSVEMSGFKTGVEAKVEVLRAQAARNAALASQYETSVRAYSVMVGARGEVARTRLNMEGQKYDAFRADVQARLGYAQASSTVYNAIASTEIEKARMVMQAQDGHLRSLGALQGNIASVASSLAGTYGSTAAAALAGMNSVVSQSDA